MLVQPRVESNKGISNVFAIVILIGISLLSIGIFWVSVREIILKSPPQLDCFNLGNSINIEKACYKGDKEILVEVRRNFDKEIMNSLEFYFQGKETNIWKISGKKCSDVKLQNKEYGGYCDILNAGNTFNYIFNMEDLGKKESIEIKSGNCYLGKKNIANSC